MKLKIFYGLDLDVNVVKDTISQLDWFILNKYNYKNFSYPKSLDKEKLRNYSENEIKKSVTSEFSDCLYKDNEKFLLDNWGSVSKEIQTALLKSSIEPLEEYIIYLTRYGTGGSYSLPNTIIVNINFYSNVGLLRTIIHEIIHLSIQKYIDQYKVGQWQKERLVDLFFIKNFPKRINMQNMPINTEKIDDIFDKNYPNMEEVIKKI